MFCDLVGSTARSTQLDPEDLREVIGTYHKCVADVIGSYEGFVAQYLGDGALIFFGYPRAHEDDAARALRAALDIVHAVPCLNSHGQKLEVRVGIATGPVVVGEIIGAGKTPEKGAIGETPNLAARLQAIAAPNAVVVSASTQRLVPQQFHYRDLGRHSLKGFSQAVQALQVLGVSDPKNRFDATRTASAPLTGRRAELAQLRGVLEACKEQGRGRAVYIRGEAGIGKTRLLEEFCRLAREQDFACHTGFVLTWLAALAATVANCPAVLVMTSRLELDPLDQAWRAQTGACQLSVIELAPLHADEATALAAPYLRVNATAVTRCVERAAGNPLFLEQLLRNAMEGAEAAVPGSIQGLVQARLDRLDASDRVGLQAAAVLGQRFNKAALAYLLGETDFDPQRLLARRLIRIFGDEFLFDHALIQEAIYDGLLRSRRRELHRRAASWFDERDKVLKAEHLDRAGAEAAPAAYLEAARVQAGEYRYDAARRLVERGLELASDQAERFSLSYLLGDVLYHLGDMPAALEAFDRALAVAPGDAE